MTPQQVSGSGQLLGRLYSRPIQIGILMSRITEKAMNIALNCSGYFNGSGTMQVVVMAIPATSAKHALECKICNSESIFYCHYDNCHYDNNTLPNVNRQSGRYWTLTLRSPLYRNVYTLSKELTGLIVSRSVNQLSSQGP